MEAFGIYLLKVSALMGVFYLAYLLFLRKETFFNSNRWFLLTGLITSMVLPFITYTKVILVDPTPVYEYSDVPLTSYVPVEEPAFEINWFMILAIVYGIGISVFLIKFLMDCFAIKQLLKNPKAFKKNDFYMIDTDKVQSPFSFFNYIVYNSSVFKEEELENILQHEQVHSAQKHSWDMMLAQIFCITFWFNPIVWLYKKAIAQNLEFIADSEATKNIEDIKSYQKTLLKVTMQSQCIAITNPFYQSLIKKRIVMLNSNQSNKKNSWKYFVVLPLLALFIFQFQTKIIAQEKSVPKTEKLKLKSNINLVTVVIDKNTSDAEIKKDAEMLKNNFNVTLKTSKIKRNSKGEITAIKVDFKDKDGRKGTTHIQSDEPIQPIHFFKEMNDNGTSDVGFGKPKGKTLRQQLAKVRKIENLNEDGKEIRIITTDEEGDLAWTDEDFDFDFNFDFEAPEVPEVPEIGEAPKAPKAPKMIQKSVVIKRDGDKKEVWINGEKATEDQLGKLEDINGIGSVFVYDSKGPKGDKGEKGAKNFVFRNDDGDVVISSKDVEIIRGNAMKEAKIHMEKARKQMDEMRPEMERAKIRMREAQPEMEKAREEMMKAREEMLKAKEEMMKAKAEMDKARAELKNKKA
ncbi:M56 family metallopeptidase [Flavobacterium sp.]|uniref:M56 family metallopeptidase n=1 Tax=Flavobacterium sp. TaxID=239 RepID=UPI0028BD8D38|nr:M56 family metallopeptidase [Flavobacterium sp.]